MRISDWSSDVCSSDLAPPPATPLSLAELTALALRNNPDTTIAWSAVVQSEAAERVARAGWWPTLTASYSGQRSRSVASSGDEAPAQTRNGPRDRKSTRLNSSH